MLTARSQVEDRVTGLRLSTDDYLVKPFATQDWSHAYAHSGAIMRQIANGTELRGHFAGATIAMRGLITRCNANKEAAAGAYSYSDDKEGEEERRHKIANGDRPTLDNS